MKIGEEIKQPREIKVLYDDNSGICGKVIFEKNKEEWEYENKFAEMDEEECLSAYKILKELNKKYAEERVEGKV